MLFILYTLFMTQDTIIQTEVLLQILSLQLAELRHQEGNEIKINNLVQLRRDVYSGKIKDLAAEIVKLQ